jgi:hypothetical protein
MLCLARETGKYIPRIGVDRFRLKKWLPKYFAALRHIQPQIN